MTVLVELQLDGGAGANLPQVDSGPGEILETGGGFDGIGRAGNRNRGSGDGVHRADEPRPRDTTH